MSNEHKNRVIDLAAQRAKQRSKRQGARVGQNKPTSDGQRQPSKWGSYLQFAALLGILAYMFRTCRY